MMKKILTVKASPRPNTPFLHHRHRPHHHRRRLRCFLAEGEHPLRVIAFITPQEVLACISEMKITHEPPVPRSTFAVVLFISR